ncbi:hypothetical protein LRP52_46565 [Photobacterium sp. ZSDE20]|uniref:Uncharacterized protein n=1 Tax=Photobacterium pectinilyticum TaxID=2906793 RepID=A0ABT1N8Z2_9GAMM|nr:hypothetical protein [Photobacterium sp. ZSDE20]MCQ1061220.1 hypothetical protein [Photobacterium sp. ZSDE20]MDD1829619.1 hypothetical protein [Photobacterium sp. ZSDE20]
MARKIFCGVICLTLMLGGCDNGSSQAAEQKVEELKVKDLKDMTNQEIVEHKLKSLGLSFEKKLKDSNKRHVEYVAAKEKMEKQYTEYQKQSAEFNERQAELDIALSEARFVEDSDEVTAVKRKMLELKKEKNTTFKDLPNFQSKYPQLQESIRKAQDAIYKSKKELTEWNNLRAKINNEIDLYFYALGAEEANRVKNTFDKSRNSANVVINQELFIKGMSVRIKGREVETPDTDKTQELIRDLYEYAISNSNAGRFDNFEIDEYWGTLNVEGVDFSNPLDIFSYYYGYEVGDTGRDFVTTASERLGVSPKFDGYIMSIESALSGELSSYDEVLPSVLRAILSSHIAINTNEGDTFYTDFQKQEGVNEVGSGLLQKVITKNESAPPLSGYARNFKVNYIATASNGDEIEVKDVTLEYFDTPKDLRRILGKMAVGDVYQVVFSGRYINDQRLVGFGNSWREGKNLNFPHFYEGTSVSYKIELLGASR